VWVNPLNAGHLRDLSLKPFYGSLKIDCYFKRKEGIQMYYIIVFGIFVILLANTFWTLMDCADMSGKQIVLSIFFRIPLSILPT